MDRSTREREISGRVGRCGRVESRFILVFILIFLDSHYWCCNGSIPSCCNTHPRCRVATSHLDSLQYSVSSSQPPCCNIPFRLVATPSLKISATVLQHPVSTCRNTRLKSLQHPVSTALQDFSIRLNYRVATPRLRCNTPSQPTVQVATPHSTRHVATPRLNPPRCNTWSQPAVL